MSPGHRDGSRLFYREQFKEDETSKKLNGKTMSANGLALECRNEREEWRIVRNGEEWLLHLPYRPHKPSVYGKVWYGSNII